MAKLSLKLGHIWPTGAEKEISIAEHTFACVCAASLRTKRL